MEKKKTDEKKVTKKKTTVSSKPKKVVAKKKTVTPKKEEKIEAVVKEEKVIEKKEPTVQINKPVEFNLTEVIIIVLITAIVVGITSGLIMYNNYNKFGFNGSTTNNGDLTEFVNNYNNIINNSVEEVDKQGLLDSAIKGMYDYLNDDYSAYLSVEDTNTLMEQLNGEYVGIGVEIRTDINEDGTSVTSINRIFSDSPAEEAGMQPGDILLKIDGVDVIDSSSVANTIKYGDKETYEITYSRNGQVGTLNLTRKRVLINSISTKTYDNVGYIKIDTFSATTALQVKNAINSFGENVKSLVIDVRDNTGGFLDAAYDTSDLLIEKGKNIYQLKKKQGAATPFAAKEDVIRKFDKIAVLINEGSASASEILALALKESAGAIVVGNKSYGKGTVQETTTLESGAMVKFTTSYWLSPNGNSINKEGINPDVLETDSEKQLEEALKVVR